MAHCFVEEDKRETSRCIVIELWNIHVRVLYLNRRIQKGSEGRMNEKESMGEWKLGRGTCKLLISNVNMQQQNYNHFQCQQGLIKN